MNSMNAVVPTDGKGSQGLQGSTGMSRHTVKKARQTQMGGGGLPGGGLPGGGMPVKGRATAVGGMARHTQAPGIAMGGIAARQTMARATTVKGFGAPAFVVTEVYEEVKECFVELGTKTSAFGDTDDGIELNTVLDHIDREIKLKASCKSLPYTLFLYLFVIWSAWLKCDTYNFGVGSSVADVFSAIYVDPKITAELFPIAEVDENAARGLRPGSSSSFGESTSVKITSQNVLMSWLHQGVIPDLWYEGHGRVRNYHKIMGGVRLRQLRSASVECRSSELREWYGPPAQCRSWDLLDTDDYGVNKTFKHSPVKTDFFEVWLSTNRTEEDLQAELMDLWNRGWLDYKTKKVYVEVGLYNGDVDTFSLAQYELRFKSDGDVANISKISTANNQFRMWYYFVADVCVLLMIMGLMMTEVKEIVKAHKDGVLSERYFHGTEAFWNLCDWASMVLGILDLAGYLWLDFVRNALVESLASRVDPADEAGYSETLDKLASLITWKKHHEVILFFFFLSIMVRFFKAFRGQPRLSILSTTLAVCCQEVMYFFVIFLVIFSNFVVTGFLLFNSQIYEFSTLEKSINQCFEILMGEFDFPVMYNVHPFAASLWFWAYMILVLLITLSMLLAVILETYSVVKLEMKVDHSEGMYTQLRFLFLQSRWYRYILNSKGEDAWSEIEQVRNDLEMMEGAQRLTMVRDKRFMGQNIIFKVTRTTLATVGVPKAQIDFFWKVFKKHLDADKEDKEEKDKEKDKEKEKAEEEKKKSEADRSSLNSVDEKDEDEADIGPIVQKLEGRLAANDAALQLGLREILARLGELDGKGFPIL